jgi:multisubunit Na+/H+ antiporter MnhG subunit
MKTAFALLFGGLGIILAPDPYKAISGMIGGLSGALLGWLIERWLVRKQ